MLITTALLETLEKQDLLISLSDWLEDKNVHQWTKTGNATLDSLMERFKDKYLGTKLSMDDFDNQAMNHQRYTGNPTQQAYQEAALHFTNESFHYSLMHDQDKKYTLPGPNFSEKTMKCWLGGTAFIPVGQFDVYRTLTELGMKFDYGLDLSFDQDPGNLTRLEKTVKLIKDINQLSTRELFDMTYDSTKHNQDLVVSGEFYQLLEQRNAESIDKIKEYCDTCLKK